MPNIEYIGSTFFTAGNGTSIASVAKPVGTEVGHCLIAQMYIEVGSSLGSYTIASTGDTWTLVNSCINTGATPDFELVTWICIVNSSTGAIGVTWNGTNTWRDFAVHTFNNVDATTPEDCASTNNTGNSTTETGTQVTTATDGAHLVLLTANFDAFTRSAQTSPLTERNEGGNVHMASGTQLTAGASGNKSATITSGEWAAVLMALRPATGIINFGGFETGDFSDAVSSTGTVSIQSSTKRTGNYALRINPTASTGNAVYSALNTTGKSAEIQRTGTTYVTFYLYVASRPAANCALVRFRDSSASEVVRINLDTAGEIRIVGTTTSADIATLANNTWYRIDMRITSNGTCGLSVDGGTETTLTGNNFTFDRITFGPTTTHTLDAFIDDWAVSDAGFVTTPEVTMAVPTGSGNYSLWTNGTGSTFAEVDEVPHDSATTYLQNTSGTNVAHTLAMQDTGTIGASGTIAAVKALAVMAESTSTTTRGGVRLRSSSSDRDSFSVDIGNTTYLAIQRLFESDPATGSAWTSGGVDAIEVGPYKGSDSSSIRATAAYLMVLSDGVAAAGASGTGAATFPSLFAAITGYMQPSGAVAATLPSLAGAGVGAQSQTGSAAATFPSLAASASGTLSNSGVLAATLPSLAASATGAQSQTGTIAATLPPLSAAATGLMEPSGAIAATLPSVTAAATGTQTQTGTGAATLPALTAAAEGSLQILPTGILSATLPAISAAATGAQAQSGTGAATFPAVAAAISGYMQPEGEAAATFPSVSATATGNQSQSGEATATFGALVAALTGTQAQTGAITATFPSLSMEADGLTYILASGTGAATFPSLSASVAGYMQPEGVGAATFPSLFAAAVGHQIATEYADLRARYVILAQKSATYQTTIGKYARHKTIGEMLAKHKTLGVFMARHKTRSDINARFD